MSVKLPFKITILTIEEVDFSKKPEKKNRIKR
jgi:hypothetical protein